MRLQAGGQLPDVLAVGDGVADALSLLVVEGYAVSLIPAGDFASSFAGPYESPNLDEFQAAVRADSALRGLSAPLGDQVSVFTSAGVGGGLQLELLHSRLIRCAVARASVLASNPPPEDVLDEVPAVLGALRAGLAGEAGRCGALASLTGVVLPPGRVVERPWGRLRSIRDDEMPEHLKKGTTGGGETPVMINDAGDIVLETTVPYTIVVRSGASEPPGDWEQWMTTGVLEAKLTMVRLAFLLSREEARPPVVLPVWRRFLDPLDQGSYSWSDPGRGAPRTPTRLTEDDVDRWQSWLDLLESVDLTALQVAITRLLRAAAERLDPADALIDTVIVWESILGGRSEMTLRVSASMARLLAPAGVTRDDLQREISKLYNVRSAIVHGGNPPPPSQLRVNSNRALELSIALVRVLVEGRQDLLAIPAGENRSAKVLCE